MQVLENLFLKQLANSTIKCKAESVTFILYKLPERLTFVLKYLNNEGAYSNKTNVREINVISTIKNYSLII